MKIKKKYKQSFSAISLPLIYSEHVKHYELICTVKYFSHIHVKDKLIRKNVMYCKKMIMYGNLGFNLDKFDLQQCKCVCVRFFFLRNK